MATRPVTVRMPRLDEIIPPAERAAVLKQVALLLIGRIKRRTKAGQDGEGKPFRAYSSAYSEQRERSGWNTSPDLWLTGGMLNSLGILSADTDRVSLGFSGSSPAVTFKPRARPVTSKKTGKTLTHTFRAVKREYTTREKVGGVWVTRKKASVRMVANAVKAYAHNTGDGVPRRHFFGLSQEDKDFAAKHALRELLRIAKAHSSRR